MNSTKFVKSFGYAIQGILYSAHERNMRIHLVTALLVMMLAFLFHVSVMEWAILLFCIGLVLICELFNTALEDIGDIIVEQNKDLYHRMGPAKDVSAGAVLIAAFISFFIGLIIFLPHIWQLLSH